MLPHKITIFVLTFILLAHNLNNLVIMVNFVANQEVISKTLCVQKDNQQGCYGKCQLTKALAETDGNGEIPTQETKRLMLDLFFASEINTVKNTNVSFSSEENKSVYNLPVFYENTLLVDTPPPNFIS